MNRALLFLFALLLASSGFSQDPPVPEDTEVWEPVPAAIEPGEGTAPPSDAVVLFSGKDLKEWHKPLYLKEVATLAEIEEQMNKLVPDFANKPADWTVANGEFVVKPGSGAIETKQAFGDIQLHIEWLAPKAKDKEGQGYSNSGIFLMGLYEVQILNSFNNATYVNGQAGSVYKQHPPMINASREPGLWQTYDLFFFAPKFDKEGEELVERARLTLIHNGVLVQHAVELEGPTLYIGQPSYLKHAAKRPLRLQDHGDPVRFRNVWVREL